MNPLRILKHTIRSAFRRLNSSDSRQSADKRFPSTLKFSKRVWGQRGSYTLASYNLYSWRGRVSQTVAPIDGHSNLAKGRIVAANTPSQSPFN